LLERLRRTSEDDVSARIEPHFLRRLAKRFSRERVGNATGLKEPS
jgi:hypothetical protein